MSPPRTGQDPTVGGPVLITGAAGFVGSNLARALVRQGSETHGLVRPGGDGSRVVDLAPRLRLHECDLCDLEGLRGVMRQVRPAVVIHTAIRGVHPGTDPHDTVTTNVLGAHHLIVCSQEVGVRRLIYTGGSSEYGKKSRPMSEDDLPEPTSLYGATKAAATLLFQQAARQDGFPAVILRLFSVYGYGEPRHRLIPTAIQAARRGEVLALTSPGLRRDFIFIEDVVEACLCALQLKGGDGEIINIGTGRQSSNEEVVGIIDALTGGGLEVRVGAYPSRPTDARYWVADTEKAERLLGWTSRHSLEEGLRKTVDWFEAQTEE